MPSKAGKPIVTSMRIAATVLAGLLVGASFGTAAKTLIWYFTVPIDDDFQVYYATIPNESQTPPFSVVKVYLKAVEDEDFLTICGYYVEEESLYVETVSLRIWFDDDGYLFVNGEAEVGTRFLRRGPPAINPKVVEAGYWKEVSRYQRAHLRQSFGIVPYPRWPKDMEAGCGRTVTRYLRDHREPSFGIVPRRELHKFLPDRE